MKRIFILLALLSFFFTSCTQKNESISFFAMDTFITADAYDTDKKTLEKLENMVYEDEKKYSRTFAGSEIYEFNKNGDSSILSHDTASLIAKAVEIHKNTDGAFSPYMGALTELWNIKSENPEVPDKDKILTTLGNCNSEDLYFDGKSFTKKNSALKLDLGGIAKGKSSGNCIELLKSHGVTDAIVSFGGSIACMGSSEKNADGWKIGIKNPFETSDIVGTVTVTDCYIAVSGAYERFFEKDGKKYHHILDPKTGYPAESDIESVAVISKDPIISDALSTALFVMGKDKALEFYDSGIYDFNAILMLKNGRIIITDGLKNNFTFNKDANYKNGKKLIYEK